MKRVRFLSVILALLLTFSLIPLSAASQTELRTSYNEDNYIKFTIDGDEIVIEGKIIREKLQKLWLRSKKISALNEYSKTIDVESGEYFCETLSLSGITEPTYILVYTKADDGRTAYYGYIWDTVAVEPCEDGYRFVTFPAEEHNQKVLEAWLNPADGLEEVSATVKALSDEICYGITDDYDKIFALHKWMTENIYYDYDYYYDRSTEIYHYVEDVIRERRTVCAGYANLLEALIRAQGIPAITASTFAGGLSVKDFDSEAVNATEANHAHTEAWVNGRWVIMDSTWDSKNKYEYGEFITEAPTNFKYFDITRELFANNHKMIERSRTASSANTPADWAKPEVKSALEANLVPYTLQSRYADNITRLDFCVLLMNMLCRAEGVDSIETLLARHGITDTATPFTDVSDLAVTAASRLGIVNGVTATTFAPNANIKRQEAAAMIKRAATVLGVGKGAESSSFVDTGDIPLWAMEAIAFTSSLKSSSGTRVMGGIGEGAFDPTGTFTRQQAILTVYRLFGCK